MSDRGKSLSFTLRAKRVQVDPHWIFYTYVWDSSLISHHWHSTIKNPHANNFDLGSHCNQDVNPAWFDATLIWRIRTVTYKVKNPTFLLVSSSSWGDLMLKKSILFYSGISLFVVPLMHTVVWSCSLLIFLYWGHLWICHLCSCLARSCCFRCISHGVKCYY